MNIDDIKAAAERLQQFGRGEDVGDVYPDLVTRNTGPSPSSDRAALVEFALSHPYGVLKPLEWYAVHGGGDRCDTIIGRYLVDGSRWWGPNCTSGVACDAKESGKAAVWLDYSAEMAKAFTKIGGGE